MENICSRQESGSWSLTLIIVNDHYIMFYWLAKFSENEAVGLAQRKESEGVHINILTKIQFWC